MKNKLKFKIFWSQAAVGEDATWEEHGAEQIINKIKLKIKMKIPTSIRKFENITIETERLDELEIQTKIIHDNIYQALMNMIDYNMLPLTKHYLEQALGNEFIFRRK